MNNRFCLYFGLICAAVFLTSSCSKSAEKSSATDQQVVATVNGNPINQHQLDRFIMALNQGQAHAKETESPQATALTQKEAMNTLIRLELLYQASQAKKLTVDEEELTKQVDIIKSQFPSEELFNQVMASNLSSEQDLREDIRRKLAVEKLISQEISPKIEISEEENKTFYQEHQEFFDRPESVQVSHILVRLNKDATQAETDSAKQKIDGLKNRLDKGEDFAELARANSDCPSAQRGGDLGFITRGQTVPEFEKCAFELEHPGQISNVISTSFGYHIVKLEKKRPAGVVPYEEARASINQHIKSQKLSKEMETYVQDLRSKAKIESNINLEEPSTENL
jgi:peptidyl-prolyl cis-trans isomerase C